MLPDCRTVGERSSISAFDLQSSDVEGFLDELREFQSIFHDCFARSESRKHFFDYMAGQCSPLVRKSIEPMALQVEGSTVRGLQRFISEVRWNEEQMLWNYRQLVADAMGPPMAC
jgi:SRSO17 transposase